MAQLTRKARLRWNRLSKLTNTQHPDELQVVQALQTQLDQLGTVEDSCEVIKYCKHKQCYKKQEDTHELGKLTYRFEFQMSVNSRMINVNKAILLLVKELGATPKWGPAPPGPGERKIRYSLRKMFGSKELQD